MKELKKMIVKFEISKNGKKIAESADVYELDYLQANNLINYFNSSFERSTKISNCKCNYVDVSSRFSEVKPKQVYEIGFINFKML